MKRFGTPSRRRSARAALLVALPLCAGCVTRGTYREVVGERDALRAQKALLESRVERLEASTESLDAERVALLDEMEDLRQQREELTANLARLRRTEAELSEELATHKSELGRLQGTYEGLVQDLEEEVAAGRIQIEQLRSGLRVNLPQDVLFASGQATLNASGRSVVSKVARRLAEAKDQIEVQGHTDDVPISTARFPSNWELAASRATEVVKLLERGGVDANRVRAVSYGEHRPVASNDTPEGRAKNRRIEIRLEPVTPPQAPASAGPGS